MPTATFQADFSQWNSALTNAQAKLKSFEVAAGNVGPQLKRAFATFSGEKLIRDANLAVVAIEKLGGATKLTASEQARLNATLTEAIAKYKALGQTAPKEMRDLADATKQAASGIQQTTKQTGLFQTGLQALGPTLLASFSVGAVTAFIGKMVDAGSAVADLSKRVGISAEALQRLDAVGEPAGVSLETIAKAATKMSRAIALGDASAVGAIKALGLSVDDLRSMQPDQAFLEIGSALAGIKDPMQRAALGFQIFGRQWDEVSQMVTTDMKDVAKGASIMSEETIKRLDEAGDAWELLQRRAKNAVAAIVTFNPLADLGTRIREAREAVGKLPAVARPQLGGGLQQFGLPGEDELSKIDLKLAQANKAWNKHLDVVKAATEAYKKWAASVTGLDKAMKAAALEANLKRLTAEGKLTVAATQAIIKEYNELRPSLDRLSAPLEDLRTNYQDVLVSTRAFGAAQAMVNSRTLPDAARMFDVGATAVQQYGVHLKYLESTSIDLVVAMNAIPGALKSTAVAADLASRSLGQIIGGKLKTGLMDAVKGIPEIITQGIIHNASWEDMAIAIASMIGAAIGGALGGPIGAAIGSLLGPLLDAIWTTAAERTQKRIESEFGVAISEGLAKAIEDAAARFGGDVQAAKIFNLDKIISEGGGLSADNIEQMFARFRDVFVGLESGIFDLAEAQDVLNKNFKTFADYVTKDGALASKQLLEIIRLNDEMGTASAAIADFVKGQLSSAIGGLTTFLQNAEVTSQAAAEGIAASVFGAFEALTKQGVSPLDAIKQLTPVLEKLDAQLKAAGFTGGATFDQLRAMAALASDAVKGPMIEAITGLGQALEGLHNAGVLNQEMFAGLATQITDTYNKLIAQGTDGNKALQLVQPTLQTLWELQQDFGYAVDEATQKLIDQAVEAGAVGDKHRSVQEKMAIAMEKTAAAVEYLAKQFGYVADEAGNAADKINKIPKDIKIKVQYEAGRLPNPDAGPRTQPGTLPTDYSGRPRTYAQGGVVYAQHGMWAPRGTDTVPAMLTPGEVVLPREVVAALRSGGGAVTVHLTISTLDGADTERVVRSAPFRRALTAAVAGNEGGLRTDMRGGLGVREVLIMGAHAMRTLGCAVTATVDATYTAADLCDGDPSTPVRVNGGSLSAALSFTSGSIDALIVANHNLAAAGTVGFSGLGTVTLPAVPQNSIRLNGLALITPTTVGATTVTATAGGPVIIGEVIAGLTSEIRTLPPRPDYPFRPFMLMPDGEYSGLAYTKGAVARAFGGSVYLDDTMHGVMQDAFDASWENSRPTVIVPFCATGSPAAFADPWLVTWTTYNPHPIRPNLWHVDVVWQELPRYRWPG